MANYLVTGGAGFIGSHLVEALVGRGDAVRVLDDLSTGSRENLAEVRHRMEWIEGDVRDEAACRRAMAGTDVVFHEAALASVSRSVEDPRSTHDVCLTGTLNVLIAARNAGVRRVVYAASSSAYGASAELPNREDQRPNPLSPYAAAKLAGEHYSAAFTVVYGLDTVCLRYFNVFGPRQDPASPYSAVIPLFIRAMLRGEPPTIYGDGQQSRDFTYIDNVVDANLRAAEADGVAGRVYNVATGERTSLLDLIAMINKKLGTKIVPRHEAARPGDVRHSQADIARACSELRYVPRVAVQEGLEHCLAYYRQSL